MKFKSTWLLIAALAALASYVALVEPPRRRAEGEARQKEKLLFPGFAPSRVTELTLEGPQGRTRLVREGAGPWRVVEPVEDRADEGRVRALLEDLKVLTADREVAPKGADLAPFGLAAPALIVRTLGSGATLALGAETPSAEARYLRTGDGPVVTAMAYAVSGLLVEPRDLRSKEVLPSFPWNALASVTVTAPGRPALRLEKSKAGWHLTRPLAREADPDAAEALAEKLRWAKVASFLDQTAAEIGPRLAGGVAVEFAANGAPPQTVRLAPVGGEVWAAAGDRKGAFTLPREVLDALRVEPSALERRKPVLTKLWSAERLSLRAGGAAAAYERSDGAWRRGGSPLRGEEGTRLQECLRQLEEAAAARVERKPGPDAAYGLDTPVATLDVTDSQHGRQTLVLGRRAGRVYGRAGRSGPVYEMPAAYAAAVEALAKTAPGATP